MEITIKRTRIVEDTLEVDDRIHDEDSDACKIANVILGGCMKRIIDRHLFSESDGAESAARSINEAFEKADAILKILKDTKP